MKRYELIVQYKQDGIHITSKPKKINLLNIDNITIFISIVSIFMSVYYVVYNIEKFIA
jgi:hypothetical protein